MILESSCAAVSIFLYLSLSATSFYNFFILMKKISRKRNISSDSGQLLALKTGMLDESKRVFFFVMGLCSLLDVPMYVGCMVQDGPKDCEWDEVSYTVGWILHLFALIGYSACLGIPLFLWSAILNGRDGDIFCMNYSEFSKAFLHLSVFSYFAIQMLTILTLLITSSTASSFAHNKINGVSSMLESFLILFMSLVWLWYGVRLQTYIMKVQFRASAENKIVFMVNLVMFTVLLCFLFRSVLLMSLFLRLVGYNLVTNYAVWIIGTRWLPYVVCSYLLIYIMGRSSDSSSSSSRNTSRSYQLSKSRHASGGSVFQDLSRLDTWSGSSFRVRVTSDDSSSNGDAALHVPLPGQSNDERTGDGGSKRGGGSGRRAIAAVDATSDSTDSSLLSFLREVDMDMNSTRQASRDLFFNSDHSLSTILDVHGQVGGGDGLGMYLSRTGTPAAAGDNCISNNTGDMTDRLKPDLAIV